MSRLKRSNHAQWIVAVCLTVALAAVAGYYALRPAEVTGDDPPDRIAAIREITVNRPVGAGKALAQAATDSSPQVRREALAGLSYFPADEHRAVVEKGTTDPDTRVRAIAANTLGVYGDESAANVLAKLIETDREEQVVQAALRGLVKCDDPRAIVALLETAADEGKSRAVKIVAMKGLLRKFNAKPPKKSDPDKEASWRDLIQRWKRYKPVREAYATAGARLVDRPQDIIARPCYPVPLKPREHKD